MPKAYARAETLVRGFRESRFLVTAWFLISICRHVSNRLLTMITSVYHVFFGGCRAPASMLCSEIIRGAGSRSRVSLPVSGVSALERC